MSKAIRKVLALSLASVMLFSNLSFLSASYLHIVKRPASNSNEPVVEKSEVQVPETNSATTTSKVATSKVKNTKNEVLPETKVVKELATLEVEDTEEVIAQEADNKKEAVVTVTPADEIATETLDDEVSQAENELAVPAKPVETQPEVAPVGDENTEALTEEESQIEKEVVITTEPIEEESEITPVGNESTEVLDEEESQVGEVEVPAASVENKTELDSVEDTSADLDDEILPESEEVEIPAITVEQTTIVEPAEDTYADLDDEISPESEDVEIPAITVEQTTIVEPAEDTYADLDNEILPESEEEISEVIMDDESQVESDLELPTESTESVDEVPATDTEDSQEDSYVSGEVNSDSEKITTMVSQETDKTIKVESEGPTYVVHFAVFTCDTTECKGFEGGVSEFYEGRRGKGENGEEREPKYYTITVKAPEANEGYTFVKWEKVGTQFIGEVKCDLYRPVYKKIEDAKPEVSTFSLDEDVNEVPSASDVEAKNEEVATPKNEDPEVNGGDECTVETHRHYEPTDGYWTEMNSSACSSELNITFKGCHAYVSFVKFVCSLDQCDGFSGRSEFIDARRGGLTYEVSAPAAKAGYKFKCWEHSLDSQGRDIYTAKYVPAN